MITSSRNVTWPKTWLGKERKGGENIDKIVEEEEQGGEVGDEGDGEEGDEEEGGKEFK